MNFLKNIDINDVIVFLGLIFIWIGSFLLSPPWSFIIVGSILFMLGLLGAMRGGRR